jgi:hypothetical protein
LHCYVWVEGSVLVSELEVIVVVVYFARVDPQPFKCNKIFFGKGKGGEERRKGKDERTGLNNI